MPSGPSIIEQYVLELPSSQNAVNIFRGEWSSSLPPEAHVEAGVIPLFADDRIEVAARRLGGFDGLSVLELGPLEAGQTWMLSQLGAASITAVEANTRGYLKCLISKEILGIARARFLLGDFVAYLRTTDRWFDPVLASGVLYHMQDPVGLLELIATHTDRIILWTHYYDQSFISPEHARMFEGTVRLPSPTGVLTGHKRRYLEGQNSQAFCGGGYAWSIWMERQDILDLLGHHGFDTVYVDAEEPSHQNGPSFLVTAERSQSRRD
jgi:hypothetical protein